MMETRGCACKSSSQKETGNGGQKNNLFTEFYLKMSPYMDPMESEESEGGKKSRTQTQTYINAHGPTAAFNDWRSSLLRWHCGSALSHIQMLENR